MNKRCIVNVATGPFYIKLQERLVNSFLRAVDNISIIYPDRTAEWNTDRGTGVDLVCWRDLLPPGSPSHADSPYGFKTFAIDDALSRGYTSVLWLDSPAYAVAQSVAPLFESIEKNGYYAMSHIDPLNNWINDRTLERMAVGRDDIDDYNLPSGSCYGFDLKETDVIGEEYFKSGLSIFRTLQQLEKEGYFKSEVMSAVACHRHDEACLAAILIKQGLPVLLHDPLFQSKEDECVIRSGE